MIVIHREGELCQDGPAGAEREDRKLIVNFCRKHAVAYINRRIYSLKQAFRPSGNTTYSG